MNPSRSAIVTVAMGRATENLDYTFSSFAERNPGVPLHAFILGSQLPRRQLPEIQYHLVQPAAEYSHPLREVYLRRLELIDGLELEYALVVDSFDVLCLQRLPPFESLVGDAALAGCVEHLGCRYVLGQGYTANFLNGGVMFWNVPRSRSLRQEVVERGRRHFRLIADDQYLLNEVVQTKYYDQLRILPCQYNYRAYLNRKQRGWPTVTHLDGVMIYHNAACMDAAKALGSVQSKAILPPLPADAGLLTPRQQWWRRLRERLRPHVVK